MAGRLKMGADPGAQLGVPARPPINRPTLDTSTPYPGVGSIDNIRSEIDDAQTDARRFYEMEPDEVMRSISGHVTRLQEISQQIRRIEDSVRHMKSVRTDEVDQVIKDLLGLFQIHSRLLESRKFDYQVTTGMGA